MAVFERDLGCIVEEVTPGWPNPYEAFWAIVASETDLRGLRRELDKIGEDKITLHLFEFLRRDWTAEEFTDALMVRKAVNNKMWRLMADHDLLITPTLAVPPFPLHTQGPEIIDGRMVPSTAWLGFCFPINLTGQPAATVPAGFTPDGLPVGLQIVGRHLADADVLRASAAFESAAPWAAHWPDLATQPADR